MNKKLILIDLILILTFWSVSEIRADITFDAAASGSGNNVSSLTISFTAGSLTDGIMVVQATLKYDKSVDSVTWQGEASTEFTQIHTVNDGVTKIEVWYDLAPTSGAGDVVIYFSGKTLALCGVSTYSSVNQTSPIDSDATNTGANSPIAVSATVIASNTWGVGAARLDENEALTEGGDQIQLWDLTGVGHKGHGSRDETVGTGTQSMTWTFSLAANWCASVVFLTPSATSVSVSNSTFSFGTQPLNTWLTPQTSVITNDGTVAENFVGSISQFTDGTDNWGISSSANGDDIIRAQWSTTSETGPWTDISAYDTDFTIATNVAVDGSVNFWFRIQTPTSTLSYNEYSSTLTVTAQEY